MPTYYLHLRDGHDELLDEEGATYASMEEVRRAVLAAARDIIAGEVLTGVVNFAQRIEAEDEKGGVVHSLPFADAVRLTGLHPAGSLEDTEVVGRRGL